MFHDFLLIHEYFQSLYDAMGKLDTEPEPETEPPSITDFLPEEPSEPEPEPEPLYSFVTNNVETHLNMRDGPDLSDTIIHKLNPGSKGVVLELGDGWSHVTADGYTGYCSNEYLTMKEVTQEEYDSLKSEAEAKQPSVSTPEAGQAPQTVLTAPDAMLTPQLPLLTPDAVELPAVTPDAATENGSQQSSDSLGGGAATSYTEGITDGTGLYQTAP